MFQWKVCVCVLSLIHIYQTLLAGLGWLKLHAKGHRYNWVYNFDSEAKKSLHSEKPSISKMKRDEVDQKHNQDRAHHFLQHLQGCAPCIRGHHHPILLYCLRHLREDNWLIDEKDVNCGAKAIGFSIATVHQLTKWLKLFSLYFVLFTAFGRL